MTTLEELFAKLTDLSIAWSIERNEHRLDYVPLCHYINNHPLDYDENDITPQHLQRALATDELVEVRAYPSTPVGFIEVAGPDLRTALERLVAALNGDQE